ASEKAAAVTTGGRRRLRALAAQQRSDGQAGHRVHEFRRNLRQRFQDEPTLAEAGMRDNEVGFVDRRVAEENQIEIEGPRRVGEWTLAAALAFDVEERR